MAQKTEWDVEVAVIGGGPAGFTAALALAAAGVATALVRGRERRTDNRTTALLAGSVAALDTLGAWEACRDRAAPLRAMRIVDDTHRLLRAPEVTFHAEEIGLDAFAWNIENRDLMAALDERARTAATLAIIEDDAGAVTMTDRDANIALASGGSVRAKLIIGADGRQSLARAAAGIGVDRTACPQSALTYTVSHTRPHRDISTEFHTAAGPFTLVPLPGMRSSIVCVVNPRDVHELADLVGPLLDDELERRAHSILGRMTAEEGYGLFPLAIETARRFGANRVALVGEAAHIFPPIGAQGLNLGLRDAATIAEMVADAGARGEDIGSAALLAAYDRTRRSDITSRTLAVDLLNRSLLTDLLPAQGLRGLGLYLLDRVGPLRRAMMREGVSPASSQPRLMRGERLAPHV